MTFLRRFAFLGQVVLLLSLSQSIAHAEACAGRSQPSPGTEDATGINFHNETSYAMRVFWVNFKGAHQRMSGWVQPGETASFNTYVGHLWRVEVNTPDGAVCSGLISANSNETCQMRILFDGGIGYNGGFCDFEP